jgi:hypothetical protein
MARGQETRRHGKEGGHLAPVAFYKVGQLPDSAIHERSSQWRPLHPSC